MDVDLQVNGGNNLNFNDARNLDEFLSIELSHIKRSQNLVVPTFITDSLDKLNIFTGIVNERQRVSWLPPLKFIHLEGFFITNKGAHPERHLLDISEKNLQLFYDILKKLANIRVIFTIAIELIDDGNVSDVKSFIDKLSANNIDLSISLGHSLINAEQFGERVNLLAKNGIKLFGITHFHNAMYGGHFTKTDNLGEYIRNNPNCVEYIGLITDGHHTDRGELLPTLLNFYDKIVLVSDASSASCYHSKKQKLYKLGGHINILSKPQRKPPVISFIDFFRNDSDKLKLANYIENGGKIRDLYFNNRIGYRNLAGSAVNLKLCKKYLSTLDIRVEIAKILDNRICLEYLISGINKICGDGIICEKISSKMINMLIRRDFSKNAVNYLRIHLKKIVRKIYDKYFKRGKFFDKNAKIDVGKILCKKGKFINLSEQFEDQNMEIASLLTM
jgi:hypothetical protein